MTHADVQKCQTGMYAHAFVSCAATPTAQLTNKLTQFAPYHALLFLPLLAQVGDCHIMATSETSRQGYRNYSCIVPDNRNLNYDVHILSVYEASSNRGFRQHPTGTSYVSLNVSGEVVKPIVLVLVSYEPIEWRLSVPSGVEIERVLLVRVNAL